MIKKNDVKSVVVQCSGGVKTEMDHSDIFVQDAILLGHEKEMILFKKVIKTFTKLGC
jgi:hypothetical protein